MKWPNDPKLRDSGVRRGSCMVGGKAAAEAATVTHGAVLCSAWLGDSFIWDSVQLMQHETDSEEPIRRGRCVTPGHGGGPGNQIGARFKNDVRRRTRVLGNHYDLGCDVLCGNLSVGGQNIAADE